MTTHNEDYFYLTTDKDSDNYFNDVVLSTDKDVHIDGCRLPAGKYRVIDGELFRVVPGTGSFF